MLQSTFEDSATTAVRLVTPILAMTIRTKALAVLGLMSMRCASSLFVRPITMPSRVSRSRAVRRYSKAVKPRKSSAVTSLLK